MRTQYTAASSYLLVYLYLFKHTYAGLNGVKRMKSKLEIKLCLLSNNMIKIWQSFSLRCIRTVIILIKIFFCLLLSRWILYLYEYFFRVLLK